MFFDSEIDYSKLSLEDKKDMIDTVYHLAEKTAIEFSEKLKTDNLDPIAFNKLWAEFFEDFMLWSANINREILNKIYENKKQDNLIFRKYCYLYQYWWNLFHLISKCYSNYNRLKIVHLEAELLSKRVTIGKMIDLNELLDNFKLENFDFLNI